MKIVILFGLLALIVISTVWITTKNDKQITDSYIACGCGCCDLDNPKVECLYKSSGDSLQKITASQPISEPKQNYLSLVVGAG